MTDSNVSSPSTPAAGPTPPPPPPAPDLQILAWTKRVRQLNVQYGVLFVGSMLLLVYNQTGGRTTATTVVWAALLIGAVITRVARTSLVNKLNAKARVPVVQ